MAGGVFAIVGITPLSVPLRVPGPLATLWGVRLRSGSLFPGWGLRMGAEEIRREGLRRKGRGSRLAGLGMGAPGHSRMAVRSACLFRAGRSHGTPFARVRGSRVVVKLNGFGGPRECGGSIQLAGMRHGGVLGEFIPWSSVRCHRCKAYCVGAVNAV